MKKNSQATVTITALSHDGRGVARDNNKVMLVWGALPDETVEVQVTRSHRRYDEARCISVQVPHPRRVVPRCEYFNLCGGCQLQHIDPLMQIEYKQHLLQEQLQQVGLEPATWLPALVDEGWGYRQKARLGVRYVDKKAALLLGFREQNTDKITVMDRCEVMDPRVGEAIHALKACLETLIGKKTIPQIEVAIGGDEVALVVRHMAPFVAEDIATLIAFCKQRHYTLYFQPGSPETVHQVWPCPGKEELEYRLDDQGLRFGFHPLDFIQVNPRMNQAMINQALDRLAPQPDHDVLDLFCGLGNFSLPLAQRARQVVGIEGVSRMVQRAQRNARLNEIENVAFYAADLETIGEASAWAKRAYDSVLLDPPRSGADAVVRHMPQWKPKSILYISCNPATFVRDAAILVNEQGYHFVECGVMDMFPQTAHVETMGLFREG